jgi:hypothetical protein
MGLLTWRHDCVCSAGNIDHVRSYSGQRGIKIMFHRTSAIQTLKLSASLLSVLAASAAAGCTAEQEEDPAGFSSTTQALNGLIFDTWQGTINHLSNAFTDGAPLDLDLGVGAGWTCWVAGVRGNLQQTGAVSVLPNGGSVPIPNIPIGNWVLSIGGIPGAQVSGSAVCAPVTDRGTFQFFPQQQGAHTSGTLLSGVDINSWCGLGEIYSNSLPPYVWSSGSSLATVSNNTVTNGVLNPQPVVGGSTWKFSEQGANASATCAQEPAGQSVHGIWFYHIIAPASGTASFQMLNGQSQLPAGTACFLTSVQGSFLDNNLGDGVGVSINFSTHAWTMTASNGKNAWALCIN